MKTLLLVLAFGVVLVSAQLEGGDGGGIMERPCEKHSAKFARIMRNVVNMMKNAFEMKFEFNENNIEADILMERIEDLPTRMERMFRRAKRMAKRMAKRRQKNRDLPDLSDLPDDEACKEFIDLAVSEMPEGLDLKPNFTLRNDTTKRICQAGKTWVKVNFNDQTGEPDIERLLRHHRRFQACNNTGLGIYEVENTPATDRKDAETKYEVSLDPDGCGRVYGRSFRYVKVRNRDCQAADGTAFKVFQIDGFDGMCPERPGCGISDFMERPDYYMDYMQVN